jgi:tryptophan-rich hypothetical protein
MKKPAYAGFFMAEKTQLPDERWPMNRIAPRKLLNSKWTDNKPVNKEKHFLIVKVVFDYDDLAIQECVIEAVYSKRQMNIDWQELKDQERWQVGWH